MDHPSAEISRHYADLLFFWRDCRDRRCRRLRHCRDHSGKCWYQRYRRIVLADDRVRALVRARRVRLPEAIKLLQRRHDPGDVLL